MIWIGGSPVARFKVAAVLAWSVFLLLSFACSQGQDGKESGSVHDQGEGEFWNAKIPLPSKPSIENLPDQAKDALNSAYATLSKGEAGSGLLGEAAKMFHAHHFESVAAAGYQLAAKKSPDDYQWFHLWGVAAKSLGMDALAREAFGRAVQLNPSYSPSLIEVAEFAYQDGRLDEALQRYQNILANEPDHVLALWGLGQVYLAKDAYEEAETSLERVLALAPGATMVFYPLSQVQAALGETEKAKASLAKRGDGRPTLSDPLMESVLEMELSVDGFRRKGDRALGAEAYDVAVTQYRRALELDETNMSTRLNLGWAFFLAGDGVAAEVEWQLVLDRTGEPFLKAKALYNLGQLARTQAAFEVAAKKFREALTLHPDFQACRLALAEVLRVSGQFSDALTRYRALVASYPGDPVARLGRALCLVRTHQYAEAVTVLREDFSANPEQATFFHMLIRLLAAAPADGVRDGKTALRMVLQLTDQWRVLDSGLAETGAMVLAELGEFDQAVRMQQRALAMAKNEGASSAFQARLLSLLQGYVEKKPCRLPWPDEAEIFVRPSLKPQPILEGNGAEN